jgi:hypothetical protein
VRGVERGERAACLSDPRPADAGAVAGHGHTGMRCAAPVVAKRLPGLLRFVPAVLEAHQSRELRVRDHAEVQQHRVGIDRDRPRADLGLQCPHAIVAGDAQVARAAQPARAAAAQGAHHRQALGQVSGGAQRARQVRRGADQVGQARGFDERGHVGARLAQLVRHQQQQRPVAGERHAAGRNAGGGLQQQLRGTGIHHAGQRPAGHRRRAFDRAGGDDQVARAHLSRGAVAQVGDVELRVDIPDQRAVQDAHR